jgi:hypothetical protein
MQFRSAAVTVTYCAHPPALDPWDNQVVTQVLVPGAALRARAVGFMERDCHAVAHLDGAHVAPNLLDHTAYLVAGISGKLEVEPDPHAKSWFQKCQSLRQIPLASTRTTAPSARGAATGTSSTWIGLRNAVICAARIVRCAVPVTFRSISVLIIVDLSLPSRLIQPPGIVRR